MLVVNRIHKNPYGGGYKRAQFLFENLNGSIIHSSMKRAICDVILKQRKEKVIVVVSPSSLDLALMLFLRFFGFRVVNFATLEGADCLQTDLAWKNFLLKQVNLTITNSLNIFEKYHKNIEFIQNPFRDCRSNQINVNSESVVFVSVGRVSKRKGFDTHKWLINELDKRGFECTYRFVGPIDNRSIEELTKLRLTSVEIDVVGPVQCALDYIDSATCLIHFALIEGFPNVLLEAHVLKVPYFYFDQNLNNQLLSKSGLVLDRNDLMSKILSYREYEFATFRAIDSLEVIKTKLYNCLSSLEK